MRIIQTEGNTTVVEGQGVDVSGLGADSYQVVLTKAPSRNVTITVTEAGTHVGRSWNTSVQSGSGTATLVVRDACPFVAA